MQRVSFPFRRCALACGVLAVALHSAGCQRPQAGAIATPRSHPTVPQFRDVATELGIRFTYDHGGSGRYYYAEVLGGGGALFDYDGDGWLDIYITQGAPLPGYRGKTPLRNRLYRNLAGRGFQDVTDQARVDATRNGRKLYTIGCAVGDYDNDGDGDLFVTGFRAAILYRNNGNGTFSDVTRAAGIRDCQFGSSAAFVDYDVDGRLDLVVCEYVRYDLGDGLQCGTSDGKRDYCQPGYFPPLRSRLYRNIGDGRFQDVTHSAGLRSEYDKALGVVAADFDDNGFPDLYIACDLTPNLLYVNQGDGTFKEEAIARGCALDANARAQASMGVDWRDVDGDLRPDLLVTNYWQETHNLFRALDGGAFADQIAAMGLTGSSLNRVGFGAGLRDLNNDGWLDVFITNGHVLAHPETTTPGCPRAQTDQLFLNLGGGRFREVSDAAGPWFRTAHVGRSAVFGDVDNDGDLDILLVPNEGAVALLRNNGGNTGNWLQFRLIGRRSNRDGIGARIEITAGGRRQRDEVRSAYSYCAANDLRVHFGIGNAVRAERVEVRWPSGQLDVLTDVAAGRIYTVVEGEGLR